MGYVPDTITLYMVKTLRYAAGFAVLFFALPAFASAQTPATVSPAQLAQASTTEQGVLVANINLSDAVILSNVQGEIRVALNIVNQGDTPQSDIRYGVELVKTTSKGQVNADTFVMSETLVVSPGESLHKEIRYTPPAFLSGDYDLWIIAETSGGLPLGLTNAGKVTLVGSGDYVEMVPESCFLSVKGSATRYTLDQGVDVAASEALVLSCSVQNHSTKEVTVTPQFQTRERTTYGAAVSVAYPTAPETTLAANEKKTLSFVITKPEKPQAYDVIVALIAKGMAAPVSNKVTAHYVLRGESATIQNASLDQTSYKKGDIMTATLFWTASADSFPGSRAGKGTPLPNVSVKIDVTDKSGASCGTLTKSIAPAEAIASITVPATRDCVSPTALVTLLDEKGNILDQRLVSSPVAPAAPAPIRPAPSMLMKIVLTSLVLLALGALVLLVRKLILPKKQLPPPSGNSGVPTLLLLLVLASGVFLPTGKAEAATFVVQVPAVVGVAGFIDGPLALRQVTIDMTYVLNLNKTVYSPNEAIIADGTFEQGYCANGARFGSGLVATNNLDGISKVLIFDNGGTVNWKAYGSAVFNAGPGPVNSGIYFGGSFHLGGSRVSFPIATIPYTVTAPAPVNGACASTHYSCTAGTSANNASGASAWTWQCAGSNGGTTASCSEAKPVPTVTLAASPSTIYSGQSTKLTWTSSGGATSCNFPTGSSLYSPTGYPANNTSGLSTGPLISSQEYQISCTGPSGTGNSNIVPVTVLVPTASISANPDRVHSGDSTTVSWNATNVSSCTITRNGIPALGSPFAADSSGTVANSGTLDPTPITVQTTYVMTCKSAVARVVVSAQTTVNVAPSYHEF